MFLSRQSDVNNVLLCKATQWLCLAARINSYKYSWRGHKRVAKVCFQSFTETKAQVQNLEQLISLRWDLILLNTYTYLCILCVCCCPALSSISRDLLICIKDTSLPWAKGHLNK